MTNKTINERQNQYKEKILKNLRQIPVIQVACERAGISRSSYYRWLQDEKFNKQANEAIVEGEKFINDMSESQLISLIKDKNLSAIHLWLKNHHQKYSNKLEIRGKIKTETEKLTPEQEQDILKALELSSISDSKKPNN